MDRLEPQPWMTSDAVRRVIAALESERPGGVRFVGGCVRNALLGEPVADVDIATQLTPDAVERVCRANDIAVHQTGIEHGTLTVVANGEPFEITTLRRDVETDGRRATVAFTEDWVEDAQRRDFRMNALYASPDGALFDPTGGGLADVRKRRIVFVGDPDTRLREDYLRILRFFRFNAWYAREAPDDDGLSACARLREGLNGISAERVWSETKKLLLAPDPLRSLTAMEKTGVLRQLFPEADLGLLTGLLAVERAADLSPDPMLRFVALFPKDANTLANVARRLKMANGERDRLVFASRDEAPLSPEMTVPQLRRALYLMGADVFRDRALLSWAEDASATSWHRLLLHAESWVRPAMPVSGEDVMTAGVPGGPAVGVAMRKLEAAWIESDFSESRQALLARL